MTKEPLPWLIQCTYGSFDSKNMGYAKPTNPCDIRNTVLVLAVAVLQHLWVTWKRAIQSLKNEEDDSFCVVVINIVTTEPN